MSGTVTRVSTGTNGQGNLVSTNPSISADGAEVAFESRTSNLVVGDTNGILDVYLKNLATGEITFASVGENGPGNGARDNRSAAASDPSLSADGTRIAFTGWGSNLVAGDTNEAADVFVRDFATGTLTLVSTGANGQGNGRSFAPSISADGAKVAFTSWASNLAADDTNGAGDVFVKDLATGTLTLVSAGANGRAAGGSDPSLSADGTKVAFTSGASDLVAGDANGAEDVFVKDLATGAVTLVSAGANGPGNGRSYAPSISADGTRVAFTSAASDLVAGDANGAEDVFVKDLATGAVTPVSAGANGPGNGASSRPSISADGTKIAFDSSASNLVAGDTNGFADVFVKDLATGTLTPVSTGASGQGNEGSYAPSISADGTRVAFASSASNLVADDTNGFADVFVKDLSGVGQTPPDGSVTVGSGPDALVLRVSQDAYQGDARYTVAVDGVQIGGTLTASAPHGGGSDTVTVLGDWVGGTHTAAILFLNDAYGGTPDTDRNLYLDGATYNGAAVPGAQAALYSAGRASFGFTDTAAPSPGAAITVGSGPDALMLRLQQDAYQGDAHYRVTVDGVVIGGILTASATRASGAFDALTVRGDWAAGEHVVAVEFLNDAYGGTPDTDRNLYLDGATYNGAAVPGAQAALYSAGWANFGFTDAAG